MAMKAPKQITFAIICGCLKKCRSLGCATFGRSARDDNRGVNGVIMAGARKTNAGSSTSFGALRQTSLRMTIVLEAGFGGGAVGGGAGWFWALGEFALDAVVDSGLNELGGYADAVHDGALVG